jgi:hypothetical protein
VIVVIAAFVLPSVVVMIERDQAISNSLLFLLLVAINIGQAVFDQHRLGRPLSRAVAAAFGCGLMWSTIAFTFVASSLLLGQPAEGSRLYAAIDAILPDIQREVAMLLLAILAIAIIGVLVYRAAQGFPDDPRDAEIKAAIRAERSARAAATGRESAPMLG